MSNENTAERSCIDIYLNIHVSEVHKQHLMIRNAWYAGQELRDKKANPPMDVIPCRIMIHDEAVKFCKDKQNQTK